MDWEALSAIADTVGVALVIVSLIYLTVQVRQSNEMALAESERELLENWANAGAGISIDDRLPGYDFNARWAPVVGHRWTLLHDS